MPLRGKTAKRGRHQAPRTTRARLHAHLDAGRMLDRIDAMVRELGEMRRHYAARRKGAKAAGLTEGLFGAAGRGTREEYDLNLDWLRFGPWQTR